MGYERQTMKKLLPTLLLLALSFGITACSERTAVPTSPAESLKTTETTEAPEVPTTTESVEAAAQQVLYYFHRTVRCTECLAMELYLEALVSNTFGDALETGTFAYAVINIDDEGNAQYEADFNLTFSTPVLANLDAAGNVLRWKALEEAWEKSRDQEAFTEYVSGEITAWLAH